MTNPRTILTLSLLLMAGACGSTDEAPDVSRSSQALASSPRCHVDFDNPPSYTGLTRIASSYQKHAGGAGSLLFTSRYFSYEGLAQLVSLDASDVEVSSRFLGAVPNPGSTAASHQRHASGASSLLVFRKQRDVHGIWRAIATVLHLNASNSETSRQTFVGHGSATARYYQRHANNTAHMLWTFSDGRAQLWTINAGGTVTSRKTYGPYGGWAARSFQRHADGTFSLLWSSTSGTASLWQLDASANYKRHKYHAGGSGWTAVSYHRQASGRSAMLWRHSGGKAILWHGQHGKLKEFNPTLTGALTTASRPAGNLAACALSLAAQPGLVTPPALLSPASGASTTQDSRATFRWGQSGGADYYLLCVARPGHSCPTSASASVSTDNYEVVRTTSRHYGMKLKKIDGSANWTVAACSHSQGCTYQPAVRSLRVRSSWRVVMTMTSLQVRNNCDSIGDGEWRVTSTLSDGRRHRSDVVFNNNSTAERTYVVGPASTTYLGFGTYRYAGRSVVLDDVKGTATLEMDVRAVDCDRDGLFNLARFVVDPIGGITGTIQDAMNRCSGDDIFGTGENDFAGYSKVFYQPHRWKNRNQVAYENNPSILMISKKGECGTGAFNARVHVSSYRN